MDFLRFDRLCEYWQLNPPVHLMIAGYLGISKSKPRDLIEAMVSGGF